MIGKSVGARFGTGVACAVCCGLPMLVVAGVVSISALLSIGAVAGSVAFVALTTFAVLTGRVSQTPRRWRHMLTGAGLAVALSGLVVADGSRSLATALAAVGVSVLAAAALLAAADHHGRPRGSPAI